MRQFSGRGLTLETGLACELGSLLSAALRSAPPKADSIRMGWQLFHRRHRPQMPLSGHCLMPVWGDPTEAASDMVAERLRARISYLEPQFRGSWPFVSVASPTPMTRIMHISRRRVCGRPRRPIAAGHSGVDAYTSAPLLSIQVIFGFGRSSQQSILDHVRQQFLNGLLQRNGLLGA